MQFENKALNRFLGEWADLKEVLDKAKANAKEGDTIEGLPIDVRAKESIKTFKLRQMQNPVKLDTSDGIKVRIKNKKKD